MNVSAGWASGRRGQDASHFQLFDAGYLAMQSDLARTQRVPALTLDPREPQLHASLLTRWIKREKPDAIFTEHPSLCRVLRSCGYRVPWDIGVAGTTLLDTDATAGVDQHPEEIGRVAALALISLINDNARGAPPIFRQILVEGAWVDGPSLPMR
jgi:LacI family transcriptional regulator